MKIWNIECWARLILNIKTMIGTDKEGSYFSQPQQ